MKISIGVWIDHRKAVIVSAPHGDEEITVIESHADRHPGRIDGVASSKAHESNQTQADDVIERKFKQQLNAFYDEVIGHIHQASSLLILGPGEAKGELDKRLASTKPGKRTVNIETTDKMTDPQIAAFVRESFQVASPVNILG
jgi:hypothetical protein